MVDGIRSPLVGIAAHAVKVNTAAHNVANVNTDEYKKDRVTIHSNASGLPEAHVSRVDEPGYPINGPDGRIEKSNVDLTEEMVSLTMGKNGYLANLKALEKENEMVDAILDIMA